ncbi:D-tyrosyl-tRNA(Tyr) deacylase, partial [bacterium]|nr:D-tyrosyl-tRNA(Tyr) deacylase [bacterium]
MRVLLQRVGEATVTVGATEIARIGRGYLLLVGIAASDTDFELEWMANKVAGLRLFEDDDGKMNRSLEEVGGSILSVSQFTLYGDARKGRRPSFTRAAPPEIAEPLCARFAEMLRDKGFTVEEGEFGAMMQVGLIN